MKTIEACNPDKFSHRVMADYDCERSFCTCCGRVIAMPGAFLETRDTGDLDGICRRCELGHPARIRVERPRLFEVPTRGR